MTIGLYKIGSDQELKYKRTMRHLLTTVIASISIALGLVSGAFAQLEELERLEEISEELDQTLEDIYELETEYGRLDRRLLEPLDQFSLALIENERYEDAHQIIEQAIQIIRVSEGLYSSSQYPFLVRHIENYVNRGDWEEARELMEHVNWLATRGDNVVNEELVETLIDVIDIHLWGVAEDSPTLQSYHFKEAENLTRLVSRVARFNYEDGDDRVPAIMYKSAVQLYMQAVAVETGGQTGIALRSFSDIGYAVSRSDARLSLYYAGIRSLTNILNFYMESEEPDVEASGMTYLYIGDWEVMFGDSTAAGRAYQHANELLLASGAQQEVINQYTSTPRMLPLIDFHSNLDTAIAALEDSADEDSAGTGTNFTFKQWSTQFPKTKAPVRFGTSEIDMEAGEYAMFSFSLAGLDTVGRWYRGRYKRNISSPQDLELINRRMTSSVDWFELTESIKDFHYRPKLVNGEPQTVTATLYFELAD